MSADLRYGSLFSGVGGLDRALEQTTSATAAWHCELDPHASKVLDAHWPGVPNLGDITAVDWAQVEAVDVLVGGFPCQDISSAGRRAGIEEGTRSGLWFRYADAVRVLRPRLVVVENVGALLVRGLDVVLGSLAAIGYDAQWTCLRASDIGAPHQRLRMFLVAWPAEDPGLLERLAPSAREDAGPGGHGSAGVAPRPDPGADCLPTPTASLGGSRGKPNYETARRRHDDEGRRGLDDAVALLPTPAASNPNDGEDLNGWLERRERVKATSDAGNGFGTPLSIAVRLLPTPTTEPSTGNGHARSLGGEVRQLLPTPTATDASGSRGHRPDGSAYGPTSGVTLTDAVNPDRWGRYAAAIARWEHLLGRPAPDPTDDRGRLSPRFVEWLMGWPDGWVTDHLDRRPALRACGNGVVTAQAVAALHLLARPALAAAS